MLTLISPTLAGAFAEANSVRQWGDQAAADWAWAKRRITLIDRLRTECEAAGQGINRWKIFDLGADSFDVRPAYEFALPPRLERKCEPPKSEMAGVLKRRQREHEANCEKGSERYDALLGRPCSLGRSHSRQPVEDAAYRALTITGDGTSGSFWKSSSRFSSSRSSNNTAGATTVWPAT